MHPLTHGVDSELRHHSHIIFYKNRVSDGAIPVLLLNLNVLEVRRGFMDLLNANSSKASSSFKSV